jgi:hypothetical protein
VYSLLMDERTWPEWMGVNLAEIEDESSAEGKDMSERVGEVRKITTGQHSNSEKIIEIVPTVRYRYVILDGMLFGYEGDIKLSTGRDGRTKIEWRGVFTMRVPGAAVMMKLFLKLWMKRAVNRLARLAEARAFSNAALSATDSSEEART